MQIEEKEKLFVPLTNDLMFKHIFGTTEHREYVIDLIKEILCLASDEFIGAKITNSVKLDKETVEKKLFEVDVKVETKEGKVYNLEMQQVYNNNSQIKNTMYLMRIFGSKLNSGDDYSSTKPVIQICIVKENELAKNNKDLIEEYVLTSIKHPERKLISEYFKIFIVDLNAKIDYTLISKRLVSWITLLKVQNEEELEKVETNPLTKEAIKEMKLFMNNDYVQNYEAQDRLIRSNLNSAKNDGIKEGITLGQKEEKLEIAKKMILKNKDIKEIQEFTDLSLEEITKLKETLNEK